MKKTEIFYVVEAIIYRPNNQEIKNPNQETCKIIKKTFIGGNPIKLREQAFSYFTKLQDNYFFKSTYIDNLKRHKNSTNKLTINFNGVETNFDLIISFGLKKFENTLFTIGGLAKLYKKLENYFKFNLCLEKEIYKSHRYPTNLTPINKLSYSSYFQESITSFLIKNPELFISYKRNLTKYFERILKSEGERMCFLETPQFKKQKKNNINNNSIDNVFEKLQYKNNNQFKNTIQLYEKLFYFINHIAILNNDKTYDFKTITPQELADFIEYCKKWKLFFTNEQHTSYIQLHTIAPMTERERLIESIRRYI